MQTRYSIHCLVGGATGWLRGLALSGLLLGSAWSAGLNDTGITNCYNDSSVVTSGAEADSGTHPRQDCRHGRDAAAAAGMPKIGGGSKGFDFSKIANDGSVLPESAALGSGALDWACTRDNVTGLVWEVKTTSGPRNQSHSYSWYNSDAASNGGAVGTPSGGICFAAGRCDTEKFTADVNAAGLCGASDWRMPTKQELMSIVGYGIVSLVIDPAYFSNTSASNFWSASASASSSGHAWVVSFHYGYVYSYSEDVPNQVRLVRTGQ